MTQIKVENLYKTSISSPANIADSGDIAINVLTPPSNPQGFIVISPESVIRQEICYYHDVIGNTIYIRGVNRISPKPHVSGEIVQINDVAQIFNIFSDMISQAFYVEKTGGLNIKVWGGYILYNGTQQYLADTSILLNDNATNYIKYNAGLNVITSDTINSGNIKAVVTTLSGSITNIEYRLSKEAYATGGGDMLKTDNLSGLSNISTARSNIGLGNVDNTSDVDKPNFYQYSIVRTVASGNLTVALKNYEGNDPTPTKPVKIMIGGVVRTITSALSGTINAGTNWFNLGSAELATKEVDLFLYLVWNSSNSSVDLLIARFPSGNIRNDFYLIDSINEKSYVTFVYGPTLTDPVVNIGRFNATLSAGAGYTWSIPATNVIVNSPTQMTRTLFGGSQTGWTTNNLLFYYTINGDRVDFSFDANGTSNSTSSYITLPFSAKTLMAHDFALGLTYDNGVDLTTPGRADLYGQYITLYKDSAYGAWTASGAKIIRGQGHYYI